jgi:hypothetical protein
MSGQRSEVQLSQCNEVQFSAEQYIIQYSAEYCSTVLYGTVRCSNVQYIIQYSAE